MKQPSSTVMCSTLPLIASLPLSLSLTLPSPFPPFFHLPLVLPPSFLLSLPFLLPPSSSPPFLPLSSLLSLPFLLPPSSSPPFLPLSFLLPLPFPHIISLFLMILMATSMFPLSESLARTTLLNTPCPVYPYTVYRRSSCSPMRTPVKIKTI